MAVTTELYFDSTTDASTLLPAGWGFGASSAGGIGFWSTFGQAVVRPLRFGGLGTSAYTNLQATSSAAENVLIVQYVAQIATGTVFTAGTDTLAMQILAFYTGASPVDTPLVAMGVVSANGADLKKDLLGGPVNLAAAGNVNVTSKKNKTWINGTATYAQSYTTQGPEWLVIEFGFAASGAATPITCQMRFGEGGGSGTDLPVNQSQTADGLPWLTHNSAGNTPLAVAGCRSEANGGNVRLW